MLPVSSRIAVRSIEPAQLTEAVDFAAAHLPELNLGDFARIRSVVENDPDQVQLFYQSDRLVGLYAMLFLSGRGHDALLNGRFDGANPDIDLLAGAAEPPSAIYTWFVACPGRPVAGFGNVAQMLRGDRFARADLYARGASAEGHRLMLGIGYRPIAGHPQNLHKYTRIINRRTVQEEAA